MERPSIEEVLAVLNQQYRKQVKQLPIEVVTGLISAVLKASKSKRNTPLVPPASPPRLAAKSLTIAQNLVVRSILDSNPSSCIVLAKITNNSENGVHQLLRTLRAALPELKHRRLVEYKVVLQKMLDDGTLVENEGRFHTPEVK